MHDLNTPYVHFPDISISFVCTFIEARFAKFNVTLGVFVIKGNVSDSKLLWWSKEQRFGPFLPGRVGSL